MLAWILLAVVLGVAGVGVLAVFAFRLWGQVRRLGHDVAAAGERIAAATDALSAAGPPPR